METKNNIQKIEKQALTGFTMLASSGLAAALLYCYSTNRFFEMGLVGVSTLLLAILVADTFRTLSKQIKQH